MNRPHPLLALALLAAATSAHAKFPGYHWETTGHFHPPQLQVGWYPIFHWVTAENGPHSFDPIKGTFTPGFIVIGGGTTTPASGFGMTMYGSSLMDDQMNTLVHRDTADLTLLRDAWALERVTADGYVFHLTELTVATDDGFTSELVAPVAIPLSLTSFEPDPTAGPGVYAGVFAGTIPAGALAYRMSEPLFTTGNPFELANDAAEPFELTLHFTIPEPTSTALALLAAIALGSPSRDRQGADQPA